MSVKICVFSDIHGNASAYRSCHQKLIDESADLYLYLGDLCGYYFDQLSIFDLLSTIPALVAVRGNHDALFLRIVKGDSQLAQRYREKYGPSMDRLTHEATSDFIEWISAAPERYFREDLNLFACHGSPLDPLEGYLYPDTDLNDAAIGPWRTYLTGHTHYPMNRRNGNALFVNPGSLGQPRHGGRPSYATVRFPGAHVQFHEFDYDAAPLINALRGESMKPAYLADVLER